MYHRVHSGKIKNTIPMPNTGHQNINPRNMNLGTSGQTDFQIQQLDLSLHNSRHRKIRLAHT